MFKEIKDTKDRRLYMYETIIIILIALILSYVFYSLSTTLFEKVNRADEKINAIQTDIVNLRLKISNLELKSGLSTGLPENSAKE